MTEGAAADAGEPESGGPEPGEPEPGEHGESYGGILGAFPYAFRRSDSRLFELYALLGGLLALVLGLAFAVSFVISIAQSAGLSQGGIGAFVRSFVLIVGFLVVLPLVAPVLLVARRHRRTGSDVTYDRALAAAGFLYVVSLYLGVVASIPPEFVLDGEPVTRPAPGGPFAPVVGLLYAVPSVASPLVPALAAAGIYLAHRATR